MKSHSSFIQQETWLTQCEHLLPSSIFFFEANDERVFLVITGEKRTSYISYLWHLPSHRNFGFTPYSKGAIENAIAAFKAELV